MAVVHLEITVFSEFAVKNMAKINGNVVGEAYFTRNMIRIQPSLQNNHVVVLLPEGLMYILTHDQNSTNPEIYIVDKINTFVPESILDLASKLAEIMKF